MIIVNNEYEYDYEETNGVHTLYYNNAECWQSNVRGTIALSLMDNGNGLALPSFCAKKQLNYSESIHMTILLKLINAEYKFEIATKINF